MVALPHAAFLEYKSWASAFITTSLCATHENGNTLSTRGHVIGISCLASTRYLVSTAPIVKYDGILPAE